MTAREKIDCVMDNMDMESCDRERESRRERETERERKS